MSKNERWEDLFARSTEDISTFLWAAEALLKPPSGYDPDHLLVLALLSRARARTALDLLPGAPAGDYRDMRAKMLRIAERAEDALSAFAEKRTVDIRSIEARIDALSDALKHIRESAEDSVLFGTEKEAQSEARDKVHAYVLRFNALSTAVGELASPPFSDLDLGRLPDRMKNLEEELKANSRCLGAVSDLLPGIAEREYHRATWLAVLPGEPAPFPEDVARSPFAQYADELRQEGAEAPRDCPQAGRVIALALGEAAPGEAPAIREHVVSCHACRRLFLDVMALSGAPPAEPAPDIWAEAYPSAGKKSRRVFFRGTRVDRPRRLSSARWPFAALFLLVSAISLISVMYGRSFLPTGRTSGPPPGTEIAAGQAAASKGQARVFPPGPRELAIKVTGRRRKGVAMGGLIAGYTEFPVAPGLKMKSGDGFRVSFVFNKASWAYMFFWGSAGDIRPLMKGSFDPNQAITMPGGKDWYILDNHTGIETIWIFLAEKELTNFDARLSSLEKMGVAAMPSIFPEAQPFSFGMQHEP